jgi:hypothetical protein
MINYIQKNNRETDYSLNEMLIFSAFDQKQINLAYNL